MNIEKHIAGGPWVSIEGLARGEGGGGESGGWTVAQEDGAREVVALCEGPDAEANARLIAAAPKLYALVRAWSISVPHGAHSDTCRAMIAEIEGE